MLASPAINPVVLVSTAIAFAGQPQMVAARLLASAATAIVVGWLWLAAGRAHWLRPRRRSGCGDDTGTKAAGFWSSLRHDLTHAGGFLVLGAAAAAALKLLVPAQWLAVVADQPLLAVLALAALAVLLSICSEADAFVAASLTQFSMTARLAFLTVGPMVDLKLVAMQAGTFGAGFALRFAPTTFVVAVLASLGVGALLF